MAKVFNEHFMGLAESLTDKTVGQFDPTVLKALVDERKVSDSKLAFPPITPSQTHELIKAIPSCKATGLDGVSARLLKIAAPAVAPYHWPNLSTSVLLMVHFLLRGKRPRINPYLNFNKFRLTLIKFSINCFLTPSGSNNSH